MKKPVLNLLITFAVCAVAWGQSADFEVEGTVLVKYKGDATNVVIPKGVTIIGIGAFYFFK